MSALEISIAESDLAPELARMNRAMIADEGSGTSQDMAFLTERMEGLLALGYRAVMFRENGETVGYALYREDVDSVFLHQFYLDPRCRGRGLGRAALERLQRDHFSGRPIELAVHDNNPNGRAFWQALGFARRGIVMARTSSGEVRN